MDAIRVAQVSPVTLERWHLADPQQAPTRERLAGILHLTPHHLIFIPSAAGAGSRGPASPNVPGDSGEIWIPYPTITHLERLPQTIDGLYPLDIRTKTFDQYTLRFERDRDGGAEDVWHSVKDCATSASLEQLYAFFYTLPSSSTLPIPSSHASQPPAAPEPEPSASGWSSYNPRTEFARQGVGSRTKAWRFTDINRDYSFCPTYPAKLAVPSRISDSVLAYAGKYRSKGRIPALTYLHWANHPMVGLKNSRSAQDERLVECIFSAHQYSDTAYAAASPSPSGHATPVYGATATNLIIDARPTTNAVANVAKGAGTENMEWYKSGKKAYLGIDNIHVMRNSLKAVVEAVREDGVDREKLRKSGWLRHISAILDGALVVVRNVHISSSHVLIHCSDGWDRTSQLSAVAQVCLDPYYRTFAGFQVLVEKDWLSFGHMFNHRSGHLSKLLAGAAPDPDDDKSDDDFGGAVKGAQAFFASMQKQFSHNAEKEVSPVFHQFLECVWQIQRQFPARFEFAPDYLASLHYQLYACQFGTFLFDSERERRTPAAAGTRAFVDRTVSAWDWYDLPAQRARFANAAYDPALDDRESRAPDADLGVLLPDPKDVRFWASLFKRGDAEMNGARRTLDQAQGVDVVGPVAGGQPDPANVAGVATLASPADSFRPFASTSSAFSMQAPAAAAAPSGPSPAGSALPFARLRGNLPASTSQQWNWSQLSSGAMSAINQIKTISADAIGQLRAEAGEVDGDWGGRGRAGAGGEQQSLAAARLPSEANPWAAEPAGPSRLTRTPPPPQAARPYADTAYTPARLPPDAPATGVPPRAPQRQPSSTNPWSDDAGSRPSLADLYLDDRARPPRTPVPAVVPDAPRSLAAPLVAAGGGDGDPAVLEAAALGGDRKAWDPLGAL